MSEFQDLRYDGVEANYSDLFTNARATLCSSGLISMLMAMLI